MSEAKSYQSLEGRGFNIYESKTSDKTETEHRVVFGTKIFESTQRTLRVYATLNNVDIMQVVEMALAEFFINHRAEFPDKINLAVNIVQTDPKVDDDVKDADFCMIGKCENKAVDVMTYLEDNKAYRVCQFHSKELAKTGCWSFSK